METVSEKYSRMDKGQPEYQRYKRKQYKYLKNSTLDRILDKWKADPKETVTTIVSKIPTATVDIEDWMEAIKSELTVPTTRNKILHWLRKEGFIKKSSKTPFSHLIENKIFEVKKETILTFKGVQTIYTTFITLKGQFYLLDKIQRMNTI